MGGQHALKGVKLLASHLGGTRNPLAIRWPEKIDARPGAANHFLHVNDVVPTIYDIVGIEPPLLVHGVPQIPIAGASFARTLTDPSAPGGKKTQYFEVMGSRGIYHDGWMASTFGPRVPWLPGLPPGIHDWTPDNDRWELYHLDEDWSQAHDLAAEMPKARADARDVRHRSRPKLRAAHRRRYVGAHLSPRTAHHTPIPGVGVSRHYHTHTRVLRARTGHKEQHRHHRSRSASQRQRSLYALGGFAGGVTCYMDDGYLFYEYNLFIISRTKLRSADKLPSGRTTIVVETCHVEQRPAGPLNVTIRVGPKVLAKGRVPVSAPLLFTANDCLDIGVCLGSPVSLDYYDKAPFSFNGHIDRVHVVYT